MKLISVLLMAGVLAYLGWERFLKPPPPPPPPPPAPPAILTQPEPVIAEAELQKVLKLAQDNDPNVRWEAVYFLDKVKSSHALRLMRDMLQKDPDRTVRTRILDLLSTRKGPDIVSAIVGSLRDPEPDVRISALHALERIGDYSVAATIASEPLHDPERNVRFHAIRTLNALQDRRQQEIGNARRQYEEEKRRAERDAARKNGN